MQEGAYAIGVLIGNGIFSFCVVIALFLFAWITALTWKRLDVVDMFWGLGFIMLAWSTIGASQLNYSSLDGFLEQGTVHQFIILILVTIWGLRLFFHISQRIWKSVEDRRYTEMKKRWKGSPALQSLIRIFLLQGLLCTFIGLPIITAASSRMAGNNIAIALVGFGVALWLVGFGFESVADMQMKRFRSEKSNKGKLLTTGLWSLSRHPNYFGELLQWWGIWVIAASAGIAFYSVIGFFGPLLLTFLLYKVSGVPMAEKKYIGRKDFNEYEQKTPAIVPRVINILWLKTHK